MTPNFSAKLDGLSDTLQMLGTFDAASLAAGLSDSRGKHVLAVGSGGSVVAAQFLALCRDTLGLGATSVQTPMDIALGVHDLFETDVWLLSASAENADVVAAARSALQRRCRTLRIVTRTPSGTAAKIVADAGGEVHTVPVATERDGYLATHSMIATVASLLLASDALADDAHGQSHLIGTLLDRLVDCRDPANRLTMSEMLASLRRHDTILLLADPQLRPVSTLIDTSVWEASLCAVQCTDFRNFAHGRHTWLHHRPQKTLILALTGTETRGVWSSLADTMPKSIRQVAIDMGDCGRLSNTIGLIDALALIEAMGQAVGIDPAKPGYAKFGPAVYDDRSLEALVNSLPASVRHKRAAMMRTDERASAPDALLDYSRARLERLAGVTIGGLVFDYDGTLVSTSERYSPPRAEIVEQLVRLDAAGVRIGIATGRGKSAGRDLRKVLPVSVHPRILMGYYNGSYLVTLDVDIESNPPPDDPHISQVAEWLRTRQDLFLSAEFKVGGLQITINTEKLRHPFRFRRDMAECPPVRSNKARVTGSGHSFDIIPSSASKLRVVEAVAKAIGGQRETLCFGDSGSTTGNDHALLAHAFGISVGEVCGTLDGCWSLFGNHSTGPDALLNVLRALVPSPLDNQIRLDISSMALDTSIKNGR